jgi:PAS domain S-box-containing protein
LEIGNYELRAILDSAPVGIALVGVDRTVRYCNLAFLDIYGWEHEDIIGSRLPIPRHQYEKWESLLHGLQVGRKFLNVETVRVRKDGTEFYARISGSPVFDNTGHLNAVIGFVTTTEDNHSEQLELRSLEHLIQASSDFMCVVDLELRTLFVNDPGRRAIGLANNQDVDGTVVFDFFSEESRDLIISAVSSLSTTDVSLAMQLHLKHFVTGNSIPVSCSIFLVRDPHTNKPVSVDFVANSLGDSRLAEQQLDQSRQAFSALLDSVPVGVALVNPSGFAFESNEAFRAMLGYSTEEVAVMPFASFVYPEDLSAGRALFLALMNGTIDHYEAEKRLVHKDGHVLYTKMTVTLVRGPDGVPKHSVSVVEQLPEASIQSRHRGPVAEPGNLRHGTAFGAATECRN